MIRMRTVQMTLDERLVERVDRAARKLGKTRSGFTRDALRDALARLATLQKERQHRRGYAATPVLPGEFDEWSKEQVWPD
jgi:metal-responsive CopG/Arc/MetJ family transcriptional regulator